MMNFPPLILRYITNYFTTYVFSLLASLSVITPLEVEMIAIPKTIDNTWQSIKHQYTYVKPGEEILSNCLIAGCLVTGLYLSAILIIA
jgi:hypothetical protein